MTIPRLLPIGFAILLAGCRSTPVDSARHIYAPHEEGLTLAYENPTLNGVGRTDARLQLRVDSAKPTPGGAITGTIRHTRLTGETSYAYDLKQGGLSVTDAQGRVSQLLPEGFPDRVQAWGGVGSGRSRILGRGTLSALESILPKGVPSVGVWVEGEPGEDGSPRTRTLLLPDIGPVEVLELQSGKWVTVSRLVARGFTDTPPVPIPVPVPAAIRGPKK